jgi:hypothetical protein
MKYPSINYFEDTDTLSVSLAPGPGVESEEIAPGVIATFDKDSRVIALEMLNHAAATYPELVKAARSSRTLPAAVLSRSNEA